VIGNGHAGFGRAASEKDPQGHLADVVPRPHWWPRNSPLVAIVSPRWWPSNLPTGGGFGGSGQGPHPFPGGCLGEPVAVLPVGDQDVRVVQ